MVIRQENKRPIEKHVPNDPIAEVRVLGSILLHPESLEKIDFLKPEDFYQDRHRVIFEIILDLHARHKPIDGVEIQQEMDRAGRLEVLGDDPFYPLELANQGVFDPTDHAQTLRELSICRAIAFGVAKPTELAFDGKAEQAIESLEQLAYQLHVNDQRNDPVSVRDMSTNFVDNLTRLCEMRGQVIGVGTGFIDLDRLTGGLQKSDLIILAARPAIGKTAFSLSLARNAAAKHGHGIAIFSLEMSREQLFQRFVAMEAGIDQQRLRTGWIDDEDWEKIVEAIDRINKMDIYIDDSSDVTPDQVRSKVRRLRASGVNIGLTIIDYLQLMSLPSKNGKSQENRVQEVSEISRKLKGVARELDMPVMALSQLSRAVESRQCKIPQLSDLRESGSIEQDSDVVMFLYRDDVYYPESERPNIADVIVAKHRNGPIGTASLYFSKSHTRFDNLEVVAPEEEA